MHSPPAHTPLPPAPHVAVVGSGRHAAVQQSPPEHWAPSLSWQPVQQGDVSSQASPGSTTPLPHAATGTQTGPSHRPSVPVLAMHGERSGTTMGGEKEMHVTPSGRRKRSSHPRGGQTAGAKVKPPACASCTPSSSAVSAARQRAPATHTPPPAAQVVLSGLGWHVAASQHSPPAQKAPWLRWQSVQQDDTSSHSSPGSRMPLPQRPDTAHGRHAPKKQTPLVVVAPSAAVHTVPSGRSKTPDGPSQQSPVAYGVMDRRTVQAATGQAVGSKTAALPPTAAQRRVSPPAAMHMFGCVPPAAI